MKFIKLITCAIILCFFSFSSSASHVAGGAIRYVNKGNYKYDVYVDLYRDCRGVPAGNPSITVANLKTGSTIMTASTSAYKISEVTNLCKKASRKCNPTNTYGTGNGFEKHTFLATVDLSAAYKNGICEVQIITGQCCRSSNITTGAAGSQFYIWSVVNICEGNSSIDFNDDPIFTLSCNNPALLNLSASDIKDNDSLVYELVDAMTSTSSKVSYSGGITGKIPFTVYWPTGYDKSKGPKPKNIPPIGTYFDNATADMIFTPINCSEATIVVLRVYEYRKDTSGKYKLVGYVTKETMVSVNSGSANNIPTITASDNIYIKDNIKTCFNVSTFDKTVTGSTSNNDTTTLSMLPFVTKNSKTATLTINNTKAKLKSAVVCWEPNNMTSATPYSMVFKVIDNECDYYAFSYKSVKIFVQNNKNIAWVSGTTFFDKNKNCKQDSIEGYLPNQTILLSNNSKSYYESDSSGKFGIMLSPGTDTFKILNKYGEFVCSKVLNIEKNKSYNFDLGALTTIRIKGTVYFDSIKNCKIDSIETRWANHLVYTDPGNYTTTTDASGNFEFKIPSGNYKIMYKPKSSNFFVRCFPTIDINNNLDTLFTNQNIAVFDSSNIVDLSSNIITDYNYERNVNKPITVVVKNIGSKTKSGVVWLKFNKKLKYVDASSYILKTDSSIKWSFSNLNSNSELRFNLILFPDASTCNVNDTMSLISWLDTAGLSADINKMNNYDNHKVLITNKKSSSNIKLELLTNGFTNRDANKLRYFIGFRNTGKTSIQKVYIKDSLKIPLSVSDFQMLGSSHANSYKIINNVLYVDFKNINLPDSSSDKLKSYGYFEFSISVDSKVNSSIKFNNVAYIYYDTVVAVKSNHNYNTYTSYINTGNTNSTVYCTNDTLKVEYSSNFKFNTGNKFKLIISENDGFANKNSYILDSITSISPKGKFSVKIPSSISKNIFFQAHVISTSPYSKELSDGNSNIFKIINGSEKPIITVKDTMICSKDSIEFNLMTDFDSISIYDRKKLIAKFLNTQSFKLKLTPGKHYITANCKSFACTSVSDTLILKNDTIPDLDFKCTSHSKSYGCLGDTVTLKASNAYSYNFYEKYDGFLEQNSTGIYSKVFKYGINEIRVIGSSKYGCVDTSNWISIDMLDGFPPDVTFSDTDFILCKDQSLTVSASGSYISYQLFKNNKPWMSDFTTSISVNDVQDKDSIKVRGTTSYGCKQFSTTYGFKVVPLPTILMTCADVDSALCDGVNANQTTFNFTGANVNKLYKNGVFLRSVISNSVSPYDIKNNDIFYGEGSDSYGCKNISNSISIRVVNPVIKFSVNKDGIVCDNDSVVFDLSGGKTYDFYKNSKTWKTLTSQRFAVKSMTQNDSVFAKGIDKYGCKAQSTVYVFNILKSPEILISNKDADNSHCQGEEVILNLSGVAKFNLYKNKILWKSGLGTNTSFTDVADNDEIYAEGKAANGCSDTSNIIKFSVYPIPAKPIISRIVNDLYSNYTSGNQWFNQSSKINGAVNQKYTPEKFDNYFVQHTSNYGCISEISDKYSFTVGVKTINQINFKIYPNPSYGKIIIEAQNPSVYNLKLFDITGKMIETSEFSGKKFEWNLNLGKGIYFLQILNEKGESSNQFIEIL